LATSLARYALPLTSVFPLISTASAAAKQSVENLLKTAVTARYWVGSSDPKADCMTCHTPEEAVRDRRPEHKEKPVRCLLCARECIIPEGDRGLCRARYNQNGKLKSLVYGRPVAVHVDPIEKKPFYHFLPGSNAFSLSTTGCPLRCQFCQNWEISQASPEDYDSEFIPPEVLTGAAVERRSPVMAFTYNEPTVFAEYLCDSARAASKQGIDCVMVSCGFMQEDPLREFCSLLKGIKFDLKGYSEDFYRKVCGAELKPVLRSIRQVAGSGVHLEIVNLVVPTLNDSEAMLGDLCRWIAGEIGPDVPIHFTRFHPDYRLLNLPPTPVSTLERAYDLARKAGIHYPYVGNVPGHPGNNTYCPHCGETVITRNGFLVGSMNLKEGHCARCGTAIAGYWKAAKVTQASSS